MKSHGLSRRGLCTGAALICLASLLVVLAGVGRATAQEGQGKYITEATVSLIKLVNQANTAGYKLQDNSFSLGGGWLKQGTESWVPLYTITLEKGKEYRFLAAGDHDAKDVDLQVLDAGGKVVAEDAGTEPQAVVNFRPEQTQKYSVRIRLYASVDNLPCMCLGVVTSK
jgi:hypothetical protein